MNVEPPSPWGGTRITTITTILTAASDQKSITIIYPWPARTAPIEFITITSTPTIVPKQQPNQYTISLPQPETMTLPILVLTNVEAAIVNMAGKTLSRATLMQPPPSFVGTSTAVGSRETSVSGAIVSASGSCKKGFGCWNRTEKVGTIVAVVIVGSGIIWLLFSIFRRIKISIRLHANRSASVFSTDVENGRGGYNTTGPIYPLGALVPDERRGFCSGNAAPVSFNSGKRMSALWLWRKKHVLDGGRGRSRTRSLSPTKRLSSTLVVPIYAPTTVVSAAPEIVPLGATQAQRPRKKHKASIPKGEPDVNVCDFAYAVSDHGNIRLLKRPATVPTTEAGPTEKAGLRALREVRKREANIAIALATAEVETRRVREEEEYEMRRRNRRRGELNRSEVSEIYEKKGDRLRKESPQGRADDREARKIESSRRRLLHGQQEVIPKRGRERKNSFREIGDSGHRRRKLDEKQRNRSGSSESKISRSHCAQYVRDQDLLDDKHRAQSRGLDAEPARGRKIRNVEKNERIDRTRTYPPSQDMIRSSDDHSDGEGQRGAFDRQNSGKVQISNLSDDQKNWRPRVLFSPFPKHLVNKKDKGTKGNRPSRFLAFLPLALQAVDTLIEPDGGWYQYHKKEEKTEKRRSKSVDREIQISLRRSICRVEGTDRDYGRFSRRDGKHGDYSTKGHKVFRKRGGRSRSLYFDNANRKHRNDNNGSQRRFKHETSLVATDCAYGYAPCKPTPNDNKTIPDNSDIDLMLAASEKSKHSPLEDAPGPAPPMSAPTPNTRLSRKHVKLVHRNKPSSGAVRCKNSGEGGANEKDDAEGRRRRRQSLQNLDSKEDVGNEIAAERDWNEKD